MTISFIAGFSIYTSIISFIADFSIYTLRNLFIFGIIYGISDDYRHI